MTPSTIETRLRRHGIFVLNSRTAALRQLVLQASAPVIATMVAEASPSPTPKGSPRSRSAALPDNLGVAAMSLYTYVPSKAELLDLMTDTVHAELPTSGEVAGGWRGKLELIAKANWELCHRHPWILQVTTSRPPLGPHTMAKYEYELSAVDGIGLSDLEMDSVVSLLIGYVQGAARNTINTLRIRQRSGVTDLQWWEASAPVLEKILDATSYPLGRRVGTAVGEEYGAAYDPERNFEFGLPRVLDGIQVLVDSRSR